MKSKNPPAVPHPKIKEHLDIDMVTQTSKNRYWLRAAFISVLFAGLVLLFVDTVGNYILTLSYSVQLSNYYKATKDGVKDLEKPTPPKKFTFLTANTLSLYYFIGVLFCLTFILVLSGAKLGDLTQSFLNTIKLRK